MTTKTAVKEKKDATTNSKQMFINKVKINNDNTASIYYRTTGQGHCRNYKLSRERSMCLFYGNKKED